MKKLIKNRGFRLIAIWAIIALLAPILANERPLLLKTEEGFSFPFLNNQQPSSTVLFSISAPVPYSPATIDYKNANGIGPFDKQELESLSKRHWLGTDNLGRDVLSNLIHGSKTALLVGMGAMLLALLIGVLFGSTAAYFGDHAIRMKVPEAIFFIAVIPLMLLYMFNVIPWEVERVSGWSNFFHALMVFFVVALLFLAFRTAVRRFSKTNTFIRLPIDLFIGRLIETMESIPLLFLLIALSSLLKPSVLTVISMIGLVAWSSIAKFTRAEFLKIKNAPFIEGSKALGFKNRFIILKHILPNAIGPVIITLAFGLAAAILLESTLSFLGFGISSDTASWGKLLAAARENYESWWLALFPGIAIFFTVFSCNSLGDHLREEDSFKID